MINSFYSHEELLQLGFKSIGNKVLLSKKASIYGASNISMGNNVRIDDFCILSGNIILGSNIHISAYCALYGSLGIVMGNYTGLSPRTTIYSAMDDFTGGYLIGPIHPEASVNVKGGMVVIEDLVQIGSGSIIFPNLTISKGTVVGAMSLVSKSLSEWGIYVGVPVKRIKDRNKGLLRFLINDK